MRPVGHKAARPQGVQGRRVEGNGRHGKVHLAQGIGAWILLAGHPLNRDRHLAGHPVSTIRQSVQGGLLDGVFARELANHQLTVAADLEATDLKGLGGREDVEQALPLGHVVGRVAQGAMARPCGVTQWGVEPGPPRCRSGVGIAGAIEAALPDEGGEVREGPPAVPPKLWPAD